MPLVICAMAAAACSGSSTGPSDVYGGIQYTATVSDIAGTQGTHQFAVLVTLHNTTTTTQTRTYPSGCPIRIRLYRQADNRLVYDETKITCTTTIPTTISLNPDESKTLTSGIRFPSAVIGDSLPATTYNVKAIIQTEGTKVVELTAGTYAFTGGV